SLATVRLRLSLAAQRAYDVVVVVRMAKPVHRGCLVTCLRYFLVVGLRLLEFPVLDLVYSNTADLHGSLLAQDCQRAFEVSRISEHGHVDRPECAGPPADVGDAGILDLDVPGERGRHRLNTLNRADQPVHQVHIVARLVHEGATIELPGTAPLCTVVILLRTAPVHVQVRHVDTPESLTLDRALNELKRCVPAVLLHDEQAYAGPVAGVDEPLAVVPSSGHWLFSDHVLASGRDLDSLLCMQSTGSAEDDRIGIRVGKQLCQ